MGSYDDLEALRNIWVLKILGRQWQPPRSEEFWNETGRVVVSYLNLKLGSGHDRNKLTEFVGWLLRHDDKLCRYESGSDIDRAELVDEWLLEAEVK